MDAVSLTSKQRETVDFIKRFILKRGVSPTIAELRDGLKLRSLRSAAERIELLERKGFVKRTPFTHRNISLIDPLRSESLMGMNRIPVIASAGCDALQVYAQETYDEFLTIQNSLLKKAKKVVAVKAVGNSMIDAGISNGAYVLVEITDNIKNGDRIVAVLGDMTVIKQYKKVNNLIFLNPENKFAGYSPIVVQQEDAKILGKVIDILPFEGRDEDLFFDYEV